jgi:hypothetical protein
MAKTSPAKEAITAFIESGDAGQITDIKLDALKRAASSMFTMNGLNCPVAFTVVNGQTLILDREKIQHANGH